MRWRERGGSLELGQQPAPCHPEEVAHLRGDPVIGQHRVDLAAQTGADSHQRRPRADQPAGLAGFSWRDPGLR